MSFRLAVCAEMVYGELPLIERVERIHEQGFEVELWDTRGRDRRPDRNRGPVLLDERILRRQPHRPGQRRRSAASAEN